jgi:hypothetical protein
VTAETAFEQYLALVELEEQTGTKTTRTRNELLRALDDAELLRVAMKLKGAGLIYGTHTTKK